MKQQEKHLVTVCILTAVVFLSALQWATGQSVPKNASCRATIDSMIERWFPGRSSDFIIKESSIGLSKDWFAIQSKGEKIQISGNNPISIASGFNWYLKHYCDIDISILGERRSLPKLLPAVKKEVFKTTPFKKRYFFNYCTFGYTVPWWNWQRWQKLIDWMAMNGINMPLAITGQAAVWEELLKEFGFTDKEIGNYLTGPSYLPWEWMGNIDGLTGPLPEHWIKSHELLEKNILKRERSFGMKPVLQGFTGHVPESLKERYPNSKIVQTTEWAGMPGTYRLDPRDSLFKRLGKRFIQIQTELYGTDHLYDADCFNEVNPPSKDTSFIRKYAASIYNSMASADPKATWVMQGWFLYWQKDFWEAPQAKAMLDAIPAKHLILLDLWGGGHPVWDKTHSFYGKPWIWNIICNLGQQVNLSGDLYQIYHNFREAYSSPVNGNMIGIGLIMEGFGYNPAVQDFLCNLIWSPEIKNIPTWIKDYATQRYGQYNNHATNAWIDLLGSVYSHSVTDGDIICSYPGSMTPHIDKKDTYGVAFSADSLFDAVNQLLLASNKLKSNKNFQFDLVNTVREMLSVKANLLFSKIRRAQQSKDLSLYKENCDKFLDLLKDMDKLLGTNRHFLLGKWIDDAKGWGTSKKEKRLYEWNARTIITLWEPFPESYLNGYAAKEWNGMVGGYYRHVWAEYFKDIQTSLEKGIPFDKKRFDKNITQWEYNWTHENNNYISKPHGNAVKIAMQLYNKYKEIK